MNSDNRLGEVAKIIANLSQDRNQQGARHHGQVTLDPHSPQLRGINMEHKHESDN